MSDKDYIVRSSVAQLKMLPGVNEEVIDLNYKPKKADLIRIVGDVYKTYADVNNVPRGLTVEMFMNAHSEYIKQHHQDEEEEVELPELEEVVDVKRSSDIAKKDTDKLFDKLENLLNQLIEYIRAEVNDDE